jgi:carbon monoxide dehydrogenase subunit G
MELTNEFRVGVPVEQAWAVLTDVERIAPCLPGAELQEVEGDEYRGVVKVKVGPITAQYRGSASFIDLDATKWRAVLKADGRDTRGQGNASATVTATLHPDGATTTVRVVTDLTITGKVAQFGRGVLADVSSRLIDQFAERLEHDVLSGPAAVAQRPDAQRADARPPAGATSAEGTDGVRRIDVPNVEPVDLLGTAGLPVAKRVAPVMVAVGVALGVVLVLRRRRRSRADARR